MSRSRPHGDEDDGLCRPRERQQRERRVRPGDEDEDHRVVEPPGAQPCRGAAPREAVVERARAEHRPRARSRRPRPRSARSTPSARTTRTIPAATAAKNAYWWKTPRRRGSTTPVIPRILPGRAGFASYRARVDADAVELRVLGCLVEKQRTTPDAYPLSLNSLRLACNQTTNRDPSSSTTSERSARRSSGCPARAGSGSRAVPAAARPIPPPARRGDRRRRAGDLRPRRADAPRPADAGRAEAADGAAAPVRVARGRGRSACGPCRARARRTPRAAAPGQKEARYAQLLGGDEEPAAAVSALARARTRRPGDRLAVLEQRVARLEEALAALQPRGRQRRLTRRAIATRPAGCGPRARLRAPRAPARARRGRARPGRTRGR